MNIDPTKVEMCTLNHLRKVTRTVGKINDAALAPAGLKSTQFSLLVTIMKCGNIPLSQLAQILVMERTTLTRNLKPLIAKGYIETRTEKDKRYRIISISEEGRKVLTLATPLWKTAQLSLVKKLGKERWSRIMADVSFLIDAI
jgi:DNA-binding MarR family transcriptional regulator